MSEEQTLRNRIINFTRKHFMEDADGFIKNLGHKQPEGVDFVDVRTNAGLIAHRRTPGSMSMSWRNQGALSDIESWRVHRPWPRKISDLIDVKGFGEGHIHTDAVYTSPVTFQCNFVFAPCKCCDTLRPPKHMATFTAEDQADFYVKSLVNQGQP